MYTDYFDLYSMGKLFVNICWIFLLFILFFFLIGSIYKKNNDLDCMQKNGLIEVCTID